MNPPRLSHVQLQLSLSLDEPLSSANSFYHEEPCSLRCAHNDAIAHVCVYEREKHSSLSVQVLFFFDRGTSHVAVVEHGGASLQDAVRLSVSVTFSSVVGDTCAQLKPRTPNMP